MLMKSANYRSRRHPPTAAEAHGDPDRAWRAGPRKAAGYSCRRCRRGPASVGWRSPSSWCPSRSFSPPCRSRRCRSARCGRSSRSISRRSWSTISSRRSCSSASSAFCARERCWCWPAGTCSPRSWPCRTCSPSRVCSGRPVCSAPAPRAPPGCSCSGTAAFRSASSRTRYSRTTRARSTGRQAARVSRSRRASRRSSPSCAG